MNNQESRAMRDVFLERIYHLMLRDKQIFFLTADFGSPKLDAIRKRFKDRFINVGIAEQNLVNVACGLALEGFKVFAYGISAFLSMRAFEQSRNNLSMLSSMRQMNINLVAVGCGVGYDLSGPSHHCLEDIALMNILPNFIVVSPSDWVIARGCADYSLSLKRPKYFRFDAKPLAPVSSGFKRGDFSKGFRKVRAGKDVCLVSTGFMTHTALRAAEKLAKEGISCAVLDIFMLKPFPAKALLPLLKKYKSVVTLEEAFLNKGGLDTSVRKLLFDQRCSVNFSSLGFKDKYVFESGGREYLHSLNGLNVSGIIKTVKDTLRER